MHTFLSSNPPSVDLSQRSPNQAEIDGQDEQPSDVKLRSLND